MLPADAPTADIIAAINTKRRTDRRMTDEALSSMSGIPVGTLRNILGPVNSRIPDPRVSQDAAHNRLMALGHAAGVIQGGS